MSTILQQLKDAVFAEYPRQDDPAPYGREWGDEGGPLDQTIDDAMAGKPSKLAAYDRTVTIDKAFKVIEDVLNKKHIESVDAALKFVEDRRDTYIEEHGSYDPETGTTEFSNGGEEYVGELEEIIEGIKALR